MSALATDGAQPLGAIELTPVRVLQPAAPRWPALIVCDHASNKIPAPLGHLGLPRTDLERHIAWDIGAAALALSLAQRLQLPCVQSGYSRLVIDCNRSLDDPSSILTHSDGTDIPGNRNLSDAERQLRAALIFEPYHAAIEREMTRLAAGGAVTPALIAVHSFTPVLAGRERPWHCGVLWDTDGRIALPLLAALRRDPNLQVGDNEPYSGRHPSDYTVAVHAERFGRPHVCIEVRQDLLLDDAGVDGWSQRLAEALAAVLSDDSLYRRGPAHTAAREMG
ncbi:MAG: N-formylglutamate amidohydrolase [Steroidobacteraceae bacterium]|nr:N-formylglutamate amidohydrolase [Steroidobacteraceae bacterium]MDW8260773.1 N-formylglutamate amidohydrolase [Gammaproteobacteria bacterium]